MLRNRLTALFLVLMYALPGQGSADSPSQTCDFFCDMVQVNQASLVMLKEGGLLPAPLAVRIRRAIDQLIAEQDRPGAGREPDYLGFEKRLVELAGEEASRIHTGRSRQDMYATVRRMMIRDALLDTYGSLTDARLALLDLASQHVDTVIPAYTHGVQAQPTSLAHYLLAFSAAMGRDAQRLEQTYSRLNLSPLGSAALGTSGFPLDRMRLAELLGFDGVIENSYDANLVSSVDSKIEFVNDLAISSIQVGQLMQNIHTQYHNPRPWFLLDEEVTDISSIMPQKRNPRPLDLVRRLATSVLGGAHTISLNAHNTNSGMHDYRQSDQVLEIAETARQMYAAYAQVITRLNVDPQRALEELNSDYSTMTEVADVLLREADVPFRVAHHYASELTSYGRNNNKLPMALTDQELADIYRESIGGELPVKIERIRQAMEPRSMVRNRRGLGGPQPAEVQRMLTEHTNMIDRQRSWLSGRKNALSTARATLERDISHLK